VRRLLLSLFTAMTLAATFAVTQQRVSAETAPIGWIDRADCSSISGWALDQDTPSDSIEVHLYDGPAGGGGVLINNYPTNSGRGDVNDAYGVSGNHGYELQTPAQFLDGNTHYVYVYGINSNGEGPNPPLSGSGAAVNCPPQQPEPTDQAPIGWVDGATCSAIAGWALDMDTPSQSIGVDVYDGQAGNGGAFIGTYSTNGYRSDVNSSYGVDGYHGWELTTPAQFIDGGTHYVYVYGINSNGQGPHTQLPGSGAPITCAVQDPGYDPNGEEGENDEEGAIGEDPDPVVVSDAYFRFGEEPTAQPQQTQTPLFFNMPFNGRTIEFTAWFFAGNSTQPAKNLPVILNVHSSPGSALTAGHYHTTGSPGLNGLNSEIGTVSPNVCNTGTDGNQCRITIRSKAVAGAFVVAAFIDPSWGVITNPFTAEVRVGINRGLVSPFPELPIDWSYVPVGERTDSDFNGTYDHPYNHFGTASFISKLRTLSQGYFTRWGSALCINDMSLPHGGVFDLNRTWKAQARVNPHAEHQKGINADVKSNFETANNSGMACVGMPNDRNVRQWFFENAWLVFGHPYNCWEAEAVHYHVRERREGIRVCASRY